VDRNNSMGMPPRGQPMQAIYDEFAADYEQSRGRFDMSAVLESFDRVVGPAPGKLLDLGCGAGEPIASAFVQRGWSVLGVDFSPEMLKLASQYVPGMLLLHADMRRLGCLAPGQFDAITAVYSLFHLPLDDQVALFANLQRWLRPGGAALFTYATREYTGRDRFSGSREFMGRELYYAHTTPDELEQQLTGAGLAVRAMDYRAIGGETFLWVTVTKPTGGGAESEGRAGDR
jgi:SAM-dependent methyltransferase